MRKEGHSQSISSNILALIGFRWTAVFQAGNASLPPRYPAIPSATGALRKAGFEFRPDNFVNTSSDFDTIAVSPCGATRSTGRSASLLPWLRFSCDWQRHAHRSSDRVGRACPSNPANASCRLSLVDADGRSHTARAEAADRIGDITPLQTTTASDFSSPVTITFAEEGNAGVCTIGYILYLLRTPTYPLALGGPPIALSDFPASNADPQLFEVGDAAELISRRCSTCRSR